MKTVQLLQSGTLAGFIAAALLASVPGFQPARHGWLRHFGWILLRYVVPPVVLIAFVSWFLLRH